MSRVNIEMPKKFSISFSMAKMEKRMTTPIIALVILCFASSSAFLSPPDEIHWMAPIIIIKKKNKTPIIKPRVKSLGRKSWKKAAGESPKWPIKP